MRQRETERARERERGEGEREQRGSGEKERQNYKPLSSAQRILIFTLINKREQFIQEENIFLFHL